MCFCQMHISSRYWKADTAVLVMQEGASALQQQLFNLLYSYAADHFQQRKFDAANRFFSAAYMYAEQDNKAKTARIMAVCNIGMKALDRYSLHLSGLLVAFLCYHS